MEEELEQKQRIPVFTVILVAANVLLYLVAELRGSSLDSDRMIQMGAMYEPAFVEGREYYRIFTHFFLHFGMNHLVNNMVSLLVLGYTLEHEIGRGWFAFIYMCSGVIAGLVSVWYHLYTNQDVVSCGASGAIYGLMGILLILLICNRQNLRGQIVRFALYSILSIGSGMLDTGIDNAAHIGGFVGGAFLCVIMCIVKRRKEQVVL